MTRPLPRDHSLEELERDRWRLCPIKWCRRTLVVTTFDDEPVETEHGLAAVAQSLLAVLPQVGVGTER